MGGIDSEVKTDGVSLDDRLVTSGVLSVVCVVDLVGDLGVDWVLEAQILGIVVKVIVVINNNGFLSINILDNSEGIKLNLVRYLVLSANENTIIEDLDEVLHVLLDLNLVPADANASVRDGESFLLIGSLDLDLNDSLLEESDVKIEVGGAELHLVLLLEVLVLVEIKSGNNGILMDYKTVWYDKVGTHQMV